MQFVFVAALPGLRPNGSLSKGILLGYASNPSRPIPSGLILEIHLLITP